MALAVDGGVLSSDTTVFDYKCGRGDDVRRPAGLGFPVAGWDPAHAPEAERRAADVVNLDYVVNVIDDPHERREVLQSGARPQGAGGGGPAGVGGAEPGGPSARRRPAHGEGDLPEVLRAGRAAQLDRRLAGRAVGGGPRPACFYVFRDDRDAQGFRARQVRRTAAPRVRMSEVLFETHRETLAALCEFVDERGRLPEVAELPEGPTVVETFGSVRAAFAVVGRVTGDDRWDVARTTAERSLLVYLVLAAFGGRPRMGELPDDLQRDVRALFGSYRAAVGEADRLCSPPVARTKSTPP